jgi:hypothetical protein
LHQLWPRFSLAHLRDSMYTGPLQQLRSPAAAAEGAVRRVCERFLFITAAERERGTLTLIRDEELTCAIIPHTYALSLHFMGSGKLSAPALVLIPRLPLLTLTHTHTRARKTIYVLPRGELKFITEHGDLSAAGILPRAIERTRLQGTRKKEAGFTL